MSEHDDLQKKAEELGVTFDPRWGVPRRRKAIAEAEAAAASAASDTGDAPADVPPAGDGDTPDTGAASAGDAPADGADTGDGSSADTPGDTDDASADDAADESDDVWPQRVAPLVWVDQEGRRYTNEGAAVAGAQECRDRTG